MKGYVFRTKKGKKIIDEGVLNDNVDISICDITDIDTTSDRCLWDVQDFLDENFPEDNYFFQYEEITLDIEKILLGD